MHAHVGTTIRHTKENMRHGMHAYPHTNTNTHMHADLAVRSTTIRMRTHDLHRVGVVHNAVLSQLYLISAHQAADIALERVSLFHVLLQMQWASERGTAPRLPTRKLRVFCTNTKSGWRMFSTLRPPRRRGHIRDVSYIEHSLFLSLRNNHTQSQAPTALTHRHIGTRIHCTPA